MFEDIGLKQVEGRNIDVTTRFENFDDYWSPFLGGQGPAPGYAAGLPSRERNALRDSLEKTLPAAADGSIALVARALAVKGMRPPA